MGRALRRLLRFVLLCALAIVLLGAGAYAWLRQSLPQTTGEVRLSGISGPIEILRDSYGIPHIYAHSIEDAHFGLGFVNAQDRLWQMEMNRRIGSGARVRVD